MKKDFSREAAEIFIRGTARPFEKAVYEMLCNNAPADAALAELRRFRNEDGGFGHALEADNWNPHSNPIATNDAVIWLYRMGSPEAAEDIISGIIKYLGSHDSFDETEKRWLFAVESNKDYPHAVWWEKKSSGIEGFNPSVSLAAFMVCFGETSPLYEDIIKSAVSYLGSADNMGGDTLKCYLLAYELLKMKGITGITDMNRFKELISAMIAKTICPDTEKYGVEYVTAPSDLFGGVYSDLVSEDILPLIRAELDILGDLQKDDGGFDISWKWYTPYPEFETARTWWRSRLTLDKLLFADHFSR